MEQVIGGAELESEQLMFARFAQAIFLNIGDEDISLECTYKGETTTTTIIPNQAINFDSEINNIFVDSLLSKCKIVYIR